MPRRKVDTIISAQAVLVRNLDQPDVHYWTAEGAAIRLHELRKQPGDANPRAIEHLTQEGKVLPDGYLGGLVPLYSDATIQALAASLRRWRRKAVPSSDDAKLDAGKTEPD